MTDSSSRLLLTGWWLFTLTVVSAYKGNLMSFMANPGSEQPIDTVEELVAAIKRGTHVAGTIRDSAEYGMFMVSERSLLFIHPCFRD